MWSTTRLNVCTVNGVCMNGLADVEALWRCTGISSFARFSYRGLAPLASHRMPTQCLSIIEVIKLSG